MSNSHENLVTHLSVLSVDIDGKYPDSFPENIQKDIEKIISWQQVHQSNWYPNPGRTLILNISDKKIKIKGAGFYNPPNVSFSGLKRTIVPVPENHSPMQPLEIAFNRDIIHVDPSNIYPHLMQSVHSNFAPVGGMTLDAARNDQLIFRKLCAAGIPCNKPLVTYRYNNLFLDGKPMGVSVSLLPQDYLPITPYEIYIAWNRKLNETSIEFLTKYIGEFFLQSNPEHRLIAIKKLSIAAGSLLLRFSIDASLYRFSGSPDNWAMRNNINNPLYFSDVDTSKTLSSIESNQYLWEIVRNFISMLHQWIYFFIPSLSYSESLYTKEMWMQYDFIEGMLTGFFQGKDFVKIKEASSKIWSFISPVIDLIEKDSNIALRGGEYYLQQFYNRPSFYFIVLNLIKELIDNSLIQEFCLNNGAKPMNIDEYILNSVFEPSHSIFFTNYSSNKVVENLRQL